MQGDVFYRTINVSSIGVDNMPEKKDDTSVVITREYTSLLYVLHHDRQNTFLDNFYFLK